MKRLQSFFLVISLLFTTCVWAEELPLPMLENIAKDIINVLQHNQLRLKSNHQIIYQAIENYLLPHVDVNGMARSVLGRQAWNNADDSEKQAFTKAFTKLVIRTYASPLASYSGETINFLPVREAIAGKFSRINSVISRSNGQVVPLSYNLVLKNGQWKVYDLSIEGVSLLQSFRAQFSQVLQKSSVKDLVAQMEQVKREGS